ncbi:hypothetical protein GCM10009721_16780 [Terrabacter tumescens]|nr:hypothetical protein GCM10009721_16780 [Terrabacter tumescens]
MRAPWRGVARGSTEQLRFPSSHSVPARARAQKQIRPLRPDLYQDFKVCRGTLQPNWVSAQACGRLGSSCPYGHENPQDQGEPTMSKRARKRRSRKGNAANHGRKPNA